MTADRDIVPPENVRQRIQADLQPVRPQGPAWKRASLPVLAWGAIGALLIAGFLGLRPDLEDIGPWWAWLVSFVFLLVSYGVLTLLVRETVPGSRPPRSLLVGAFSATLLGQLAVATTLDLWHPFPVPEGQEVRLTLACSGSIGLLSLPVYLAALALVRKGLAGSWIICTVLMSCAAVAVGESLWRLHCPYTSPSHLLLAHFPPYVILILVGLSLRWRRR